MKSIYTLAAIATFGFVSAQKNELREFSTLAVTGKINLTFVKATTSSIEVTKGNAGNLKIASDGENTALSLAKGNEGVSATVYYTSAMQNLAVGGGAEAHSKDAFTGTEFALSVAAGSKVHFVTDVETLQTAAASGSEVVITGKAKKIEAAIASGANFDAKKVEATKVEITIAAGAKAAVNAKDEVSVNVASGGELTIYGNPKQVNEVKAANGVVKRAK
ncbi:hypothetical protein AM493_14265 [Flavobacterium akiainvivens]|uniref:Putative auto-transporter adhesin head GIN domain-containing protein n=1 Tax=Flavobacterium akiainvivens TaxID=1202724 RepID=A0A0M8MJY0_9FLAO|nr:DUF2807 domain-containing protein [Flavobacterium akiainvivens]KOS07068.1 hypothetical protein AM493_14265 [Flavobacterium akiainvivens]SFQ58551.1 Putative auto-transporter adhesin, head GIN domain [Flavobacterium akiainvivens]